VRKPTRFGITGVGVGFCLATLLIALGYCFPSFFYNFPTLYLCLAPASVLYMLPLGSRVSLSVQAVIALIVAISNALIYGFAFFVIGQIWMWFSR